MKQSIPLICNQIIQQSAEFEQTLKKLSQLGEVISRANQVLVLTHDNPDPDSLASAYAFRHLLRRWGGLQADIGYGGVIGRAENRAMVREMRIPLIPVTQIDWDDYDLLSLVDHQPRPGWERWPRNRLISAVIDHHPLRRKTLKIPFVDVRRGFGSNSTLLAQYLFAAGIRIPSLVSSALSHGIRSDTQQFSRGTTPADLDAYMALFPQVNHDRLHRVLRPLIERNYMQGLWAGFSRAVIWKEAAATYAGPVAAPDLPAEIADQLMRLRGVIYAIACGFHEQVLYVSARIRNSRKDAGRLLRRIIGRSGSAGGHGFMAGGQVCVGPDPDASQEQAQAIICRFMKLIYPGETPPAELPSLIDPKSLEPNNRLHAEC